MDDDGDDDTDDNDYDDDDDEPAPWDPVWEKGFKPAPPLDSSFMFLQIKAGPRPRNIGKLKRSFQKLWN